MTSIPPAAARVHTDPDIPPHEKYRGDRYPLIDPTTLSTGDEPGPDAYHEMIDTGGSVRPPWSDLVTTFERTGGAGLRRTDERLRTMVADEGITYTSAGNRTAVPGTAQPWALDSVPLVIAGDEWSAVEAGIAQRCRLLNALLADLYGEQRALTSGVIPPEMVFGHPGYLRTVRPSRTTGHRGLSLCAVDIGRRADGEFTVWGDHTGAPSGIGYALADRKLISRVLSGSFGRVGPLPATGFVAALRSSLIGQAPTGVDDPMVVVFSPGAMSETAFDQAYLASILGFPLVESEDLLVRDGAVYLRSLGSLTRVDVIARRVDAAFCDPLDLRSDSRLGVAGLVEAVARGNVTVVNDLGAGVLENPALYTVSDRLARVLLDDDLDLSTVPTYWAGDPVQAGKIVADIRALVVDNVVTGEQFLGPELTRDGAAELRTRVRDQGWPWSARVCEQFSLAPVSGHGRGASGTRFRAAPVAMRSFAVAQGTGYAVMPGGLGHILAPGSAGSAMRTVGAKDVWITPTDETTRVAQTAGLLAATSMSRDRSSDRSTASPRVLADLFWFGRYAERAESTVRIIRVAVDRYADQAHRASGDGALPRFLAGLSAVTATSRSLGLTRERIDATAHEVPMDALLRLTVERAMPGTVAHAVERLVTTARAVRDQMSTSVWMVLRTIEGAVADLTHAMADDAGEPGAEIDTEAVDLDDLSAGLESLLRGLLALSGLQAESMVRDPGWLFMDVGRRLERVITLSDLMRSIVVGCDTADVERSLHDAFLTAAESAVTHRRRHRGIVQLRSVLALTLLDDTNPRSMIYQLHRLRDDLSAMPDRVRSAAAERGVDELIAELRRADPLDLSHVEDGRRVHLDALLTDLGRGARDISDLLERTRFAPPRRVQPLAGGSGERAR